jgi:hypothetical protein
MALLDKELFSEAGCCGRGCLLLPSDVDDSLHLAAADRAKGSIVSDLLGIEAE